MIRPIIPLAALGLAIAACGGDDETTTSTRAAAAGPSAARYCHLTRRLDKEGEKFFSGLGRDATPEEYEDAERRFVDEFTPQLAAIEAAAPAGIKADVRKLLAAQRARAGLPAGADVDQADATAAEKRLHRYEAKTCAS